MDDKQINMIEQYYNAPAQSTIYCKECGCAVDIAEQEKAYTIDSSSGKIKPLTIILFIAVAILSLALIICAHIITEIKKPSSKCAVYICKSVNEINISEYYKNSDF